MTSALTRELERMREQGQTPACHGGDEWLSDDARERARAVELCAGCPVAGLCLLDALDNIERPFGVWGGHDLTRLKRKELQALRHPPTIAHAAGCRTPAPVLRRSWAGRSELFCPGCGRSCEAGEAR